MVLELVYLLISGKMLFLAILIEFSYRIPSAKLTCYLSRLKDYFLPFYFCAVILIFKP